MVTAIYQISMAGQSAGFPVAAGQTLLQGMEKCNGRFIRVGCRGGGCGLCKVRVLSGEYETGRMSSRHVCAQQAAEGYALACRIRPQSDLLLEAAQSDTL